MESICLPLAGGSFVEITSGPIHMWYRGRSFDRVEIPPCKNMDVWIERLYMLQDLLSVGGEVLWQWSDPKLPNTGFVVTDDLCVVYNYKGSMAKTGSSDPAAAIRAYKAWRRWENKPNGLWCKPARPELYAFYANFPEVRCV